jgi:YHS domain-containing protein
MAKDPVCNMMVDEKKTQHISEVNGQKVYLCSAHCKSQFDQNPSKYGYQK